jgi:hypothetical protein
MDQKFGTRTPEKIHLFERWCINRGTEAIESIRIVSEISGPKDSEYTNLKPFNRD